MIWVTEAMPLPVWRWDTSHGLRGAGHITNSSPTPLFGLERRLETRPRNTE